MECLNCGKTLTGLQKKYCSKKCKQHFLITKKRQLFREKTGLSLQSEKGIQRKLILIEEFGGGCEICGYNRNLSALEFHHKEPHTKSFTIDMRSLSNRGEGVIREELDKCSLLCSNCHQEIHNPHLNTDNFS